ncbi:MAG: sulfite exporter TauE/SafE family protein [Deltaproteobacteria bacterium]|nr:sulfite exporter TauE/SafE family protein [Deltaproteobacteria bacterium]
MLPTLLLCLIALFAGFTQGLAGFGSVLVALPLMALLLDLQTAVPLAGLWGMSINIILLVTLRRHLSLKRIWPLAAAAVPGIPFGVYTLVSVPVWIMEMVLGGVLVVFSVYFALSGGGTRNLARGWAYCAGFTSGFLGGSLAASGPPVIIYTALQPWPKDEIKSTLTGFFFLSGLIILAAQAAGGLITSRVLSLGLYSLPFIFLGVFLGSWCYDKLDSQRYRQVVVGLITLLGLLTLAKALGW